MDPLTVVLGILSVLFFLKLMHVSDNGPPGPTGYPLVGNFPLFISGNRPKLFDQLRRKYGDVFSLQLGSRRMVVINGYEARKEAFVKQADVFSERPTADYVSIRSSNGKEVIGKSNGDAFALGTIAQISVSNIICSISFGERYSHDDQNFKRVMMMIDIHVKLLSKAAISTFFPVVRYIPGDVTGVEAMGTNYDNIKRFLQEQIDKHRASFQKENVRDLIDAFILEEMTRGKTDYLEDENLAIVLYNLFVAGTETTSTTIKWAILYIISNPHVQTKLRNEINDVMGLSRAPSMTDKPEMTYMDAFMHETFRMGNLVPFSLLHGVKKDVTFKGYTIRREDLVVHNLESALFDESLFEDPRTFNPDRFIGEDGKLNGKEHTVLAFSLGRRVCFGESLARMEVFLFLTSLLQRFKLLPEDEKSHLNQ
ncbi:cytochrome P450 2C25-like [Pecten maximus]|uniref:cytochrome P450 2C25-like n=1 Tax=Pecten maximus TaxID=6579 RepID=UPI00145848BD|nr:cytochrome P450 2C25-like [Pecten maximus]